MRHLRHKSFTQRQVPQTQIPGCYLRIHLVCSRGKAVLVSQDKDNVQAFGQALAGGMCFAVSRGVQQVVTNLVADSKILAGMSRQ